MASQNLIHSKDFKLNEAMLKSSPFALNSYSDQDLEKFPNQIKLDLGGNQP